MFIVFRWKVPTYGIHGKYPPFQLYPPSTHPYPSSLKVAKGEANMPQGGNASSCIGRINSVLRGAVVISTSYDSQPLVVRTNRPRHATSSFILSNPQQELSIALHLRQVISSFILSDAMMQPGSCPMCSRQLFQIRICQGREKCNVHISIHYLANHFSLRRVLSKRTIPDDPARCLAIFSNPFPKPTWNFQKENFPIKDLHK